MASQHRIAFLTTLPEPLLGQVVQTRSAKLSPNQNGPRDRAATTSADRPTDEVAAILGASRATVHVHLSQWAEAAAARRLLEDDD
jgi:hypothetical protein